MRNVKVFIIWLSIVFLPSFSVLVSANNAQIDSLLIEAELSADIKNKTSILLQVSQLASKSNLYDEAVQYAEESLEIAVENKLIEEEINALIELSTIHRPIDINLAFKYASLSKEKSDKHSFTIKSAQASLLLSKLLYLIGEYDKSIELAYTTIKVFENSGKYKDWCGALNMIGINYLDNGNDSLAKQYLKQAVEISKENSIYSELGAATINLATIYGRRDELTIAINILKQGCEDLKKFKKSSQNIEVGYFNIAIAYLDLAIPDSAFVYLKKAQELSLSTNNIRNLAIINLGLANYYEYVNNDKDFLFHIYRVAAISNDHDLKQLSIKAIAELEKYYFKHNYLDSAYKYKTLRYNLAREIDQLNTSTKIAQFELQKQLELAERERLYKADKKALYMLIIFIVLFSMLVLTITLLLRSKIKVRYSTLKQEKLEDEIYFKNKESTVSLMEIMKKNELLTDVTTELLSLSKSTQNEEFSLTINKIAIKIENITKEKIWDEFTLRFQQVHTDFYKNLSDNYPNLTSNEQRLCAFLKLNLSTKEMSSITGQSERAITMARYRLRKKMGIESQEVNLTSFISKI